MKEFWHGIKAKMAWLTVPIVGGPLKGTWWGLAAGMPFLRGRFKTEKTRVFQDLVREGDVFLDVGAHVGYYSVLASKIVGSGGKVFSFEPQPLNLAYLKSHLKRNRIKNVEVIEACVGEKSGTVRFEGRTGTGRGHISAEGDREFAMVSLDELWAQGRVGSPTLIKIDVEGGETGVLAGGRKMIAKLRPRMLVETHGAEVHRKVVEYLESERYQLKVVDSGGDKGGTEVIALPGN